MFIKNNIQIKLGFFVFGFLGVMGPEALASFNASDLQAAREALSPTQESLPPVRPTFNAHELQAARAALSSSRQHVPEVVPQRPNLSAVVTLADIIHFRRTANKVTVGSSIAKRVLTSGERLLKDIREQRRHVKAPQKVLKNDPVGVSWSQYLTALSSPALREIGRDYYIAENLVRLSHPGRLVVSQDKSYGITGEDIECLQKLTDKHGGKGNVKSYLKKQRWRIVLEMQAQKSAFRAVHRPLMASVLNGLAAEQDLLRIQKKYYVGEYQGNLWEEHLVQGYAEQEGITLSELERYGHWIQSDEVVYEIQEKGDLTKWMTSWRLMLDQDYARHTVNQHFLTTIEAQDRSDTLYFQGLLQQVGHQNNGTVAHMLETAHQSLLPPNYLKSLMAQKMPVVIEITKRLTDKRSLAEQLLQPIQNTVPRFMTRNWKSSVAELDLLLVDEVEETRVARPVGLEMIPFGDETHQEVSLAFKMPHKPLWHLDNPESDLLRAGLQGIEMDVDTTYVYDQESGRYVLASAYSVLPDFFFTLKQSVTPGFVYNAYHNTIGVLGNATGYIAVKENGGTERAYYALHTDTTIFSQTKTGGVASAQ